MPKTEAQKRAANAEKQRRYRERQRQLKAAASNVTGNAGDVPAPTTTRDAVADALKAMKWLVSSDDAAVAQAKMLAQDVDELRHAGKTTAYLSAQRALTTVLDRLGGTPVVRQQHELRSRKLTPEVPDGGDGAEAQAGKGNVSRFERPAKRRAG